MGKLFHWIQGTLIFIAWVCYLFPYAASAQDTLKYKNGSYAIGKRDYNRKYGKWNVFNEDGELIRIEKYKHNRLHGYTKFIPEKYKLRYRFGVGGLDLYNSQGQRMVFYFTYGMPNFRDQSIEEEEFACYDYAIAGCVVTRKIEARAWFHNFFVDIHQIFRFGFRWKARYFGWDEPWQELPDSLQI